MSISVDIKTLEALQNPKQIPVDMIEFRLRDRATGEIAPKFIWSGIEPRDIAVVDPTTGFEKLENWTAGGALIGVSPVPRTSGLIINRVTISMSGVSEHVRNMYNQYEIKYSTVILYRGYIDPDTDDFVAPARSRFLGEVSDLIITEPDETSQTESGGVEITLKNNMHDLTRTNPATRSDVYQKRRNPNDTFRKYVSDVATKEFDWGKKA